MHYIDSRPSFPQGINSPQILKSVDAQVPCKKLYNGGPSTSADVEPANRRANCMNLLNPHNYPGVVVIYYHPAPFSEEESKVQRIKVTQLVDGRAKRKAQRVKLRATHFTTPHTAFQQRNPGAYNSWLSPYINSSCLWLGLLVTTRKRDPRVAWWSSLTSQLLNITPSPHTVGNKLSFRPERVEGMVYERVLFGPFCLTPY